MSARLDALYGHMITDYERPKAFETKSDYENAEEQVKGYESVSHKNWVDKFKFVFLVDSLKNQR